MNLNMDDSLPKCILFDLDGTLVDSVPDLAFAVDAMMVKLGLPERGIEAVRTWVGNGIEKLVARALTNSMDELPEEKLFEQALPVFLSEYTNCHARLSEVYDGVVDTLEWLVAQGVKLACVTNKAEAFTLPLLEAKGLSGYFQVVVSGDTCAHKKPNPEPLKFALARLQCDHADAVMVGDSKSDINAAKAAGCRVIALTYGYNHGEDIRDYSPDHVIDSFLELPAVFRQK